MASLLKSQIESFFDSPVQKEIEQKIEGQLCRTDVGLEHPDPFMHGVAVGERRAYQSVLRFKEILLTEAGGKSPYGNKGDV